MTCHVNHYGMAVINYIDYTLKFLVFDMLDKKLAPNTTDQFARHYNTKLKRYNSRFYKPGAEAVDVFFENRESENNSLVPPVLLDTRNHAKPNEL